MAAGINYKDSSLQELADYLDKIEEAEVTLQTDKSGASSTLYFKPQPKSVPGISNMDLVCRWAEAHEYTTSLRYNEFSKAIEVGLFKLYPDE